MKDMFFSLHGWYMPEKKMLHIDLKNLLFHQLNSSPKALKFYLPSQLRLSGCEPMVVGTSLNFDRAGRSSSISEIHGAEDFSDSVAFFRTLRALMHTISYVTIAEPKFLPFNVGMTLLTKCLCGCQ